ncbi:NAD dependent epimerase/dehydratase [Penicillium riverlandense]|uniref:NAD dependent epimerase/dehydratase n=1 Tax=Penicillium riverlandense TaxID=1903569 RepID=UPI0025477889|nr:NAD dependent epimerase/dehydratase [Penicillium riverlandense]KAJ5833006.1 NAD dependent epimerase/dehydratase [Penicillium riverlandense]
MNSSTIFVFGATGTQGGAVTKHLLQRGAKVRTITRNPDSPAAQKLQSLGVSVEKGDLENETSLRDNIANCTSLFLVLTPSEEEINRARRVMEVAKKAGVQQIVYSSGAGINRLEEFAHWDPNAFFGKMLLSKKTIEEEVRNAGFKYWTILRPGNFMSNFLPPHVHMYKGFLESGRFTTAWTPETLLAMVDPNDIGKFGATALLDPVKFHEKDIDLASELLGIEPTIQKLAKITGRDLRVVFLSQEEVETQSQADPFIGIQLVMRDQAQFVDMRKVKSWNIDLGNFEQFLEREKDDILNTFAQ